VTPPIIQYLNTDLDLVCEGDPAVLVAELASHGLVAHVTRQDDGVFYVLCEDDNDTEPEPLTPMGRACETRSPLQGGGYFAWTSSG
jgi:hypothetical protein